MVQITYIFMVMRNKIVWDQLADRAARLKVLPFASLTPIAVVDWAGDHCHAEVGGDAAHIIRQLPDQPGCRYRIYIYVV